MARRLLFLIVTCCIAVGPATSVAYAGNSKKPNIIFILADDLGYGDLGCYGQKKIKTPNLDRMAAQGLRFRQFYAGSTVCAPSRCALMTGLHTGHCRVRGNALVPLRPEDVTVATLLQNAGYATALIGKWGLGEDATTGVPNRQGFDCFFGYLNQHHAHNSYPDFLWRNQEKVAIPENVVKDNVASKRVTHSHDLFTQHALQFIEQSKERPFFLYLAYTIPHANNERGRVEKNGIEAPSDELYASEPWPAPQKSLAAAITYMDRDIGRIFDRLRELGIDDNTIVFFSSDNGPHREGGNDPFFFVSMGPLRGFKRSLHDGGVRVPMIVRWPGKSRTGETDHVGAFWDFLPTACELGGAKVPSNLDGISFVPTLLGREQKQHDFLYWEFFEGGFQQAIRLGNWKAVRPKLGGPLELYDLAADIGEKNNIADRHRDVIERLETCLRMARTDSPDFPVKKSDKKGKKK